MSEYINLIKRLRDYSNARKGEIAELTGEAADALERQKGEWIEFPASLSYKNAYSDTQIVCSACEAVFDIIDNCTEAFNFCPNCGADMRKDGGT